MSRHIKINKRAGKYLELYVQTGSGFHGVGISENLLEGLHERVDNSEPVQVQQMRCIFRMEGM